MGSIGNHSEADTCPIPTFDFSKWTQSQTEEERLNAAKELIEACREFGCAYITSLPLPNELINEAFDKMKHFFDLSHDKKMQAPHPNHANVHRGYSYPGLEMVNRPKPGETNFTQDWRESYDIGSDENAEQPNQWLPENTFLGFREFETHFYWECEKVARLVVTAFALGLGLQDPEDLMKFHSGHHSQLRLLHYPSLPVEELENKTKARLPPHCDFDSFTMLFQDSCGGLEFEDPHHEGGFIPAPPKEGACLLNIGDYLMIWSNDYLPSRKHRVGLSPQSDQFEGEKRMTRDRYAIPYFVAPDPDTVVQCLPCCVRDNRPANYEPVTQRAWTKMKFAYVFPEKE